MIGGARWRGLDWTWSWRQRWRLAVVSARQSNTERPPGLQARPTTSPSSLYLFKHGALCLFFPFGYIHFQLDRPDNPFDLFSEPGSGRLGTTTSYKLTDIKRFHKFHLVCSVSLALLVLQVSLLSLDSLQVFARGRPIQNIARGTIDLA